MLLALQNVAGEEPPDCSGQLWSLSLCHFCHGDPLSFVVVDLHGGEADCSHLVFIMQSNLAFLLLLRGPESTGLSRTCDAGETRACLLLSSITHKIGFLSKESKGVP